MIRGQFSMRGQISDTITSTFVISLLVLYHAVLSGYIGRVTGYYILFADSILLV